MYIRHFREKLILSSFRKTITNLWKILPKNFSNTIFAVSSGAGKCGVAIIRVSGPRSRLCLEHLCGGVTKPRVASLRKLIDPHTKEVLDKALVLWFPGTQSFTGEDCAELHVHGGPAVISSVLSALSSIEGFMPAQAGDFTKQAFLNGKLDLTEVEGLGDLIHADTEAQRKQALRQMEGDLGKIYTGWRTRLIKYRADVEAFIDFHEEENIEDDILDSVTSEVSKLQKEMVDHLSDSRRGERLRDGLRVVILGEPNVGKSSLLNAICQRPAAIVSPIAGTTRDVVETALNIVGYPVLLSDTAGLRETTDVVEKEGVSRAMERAHSADLKILMLDSPSYHMQLECAHSFSDFVNAYMQKLGLLRNNKIEVERKDSSYNELASHATLVHSGNEYSSERVSFPTDTRSECVETLDLSDLMVVINKCDLASDNVLNCVVNSKIHVCGISCKTGEGLPTFMDLLVSKIKTLCGDPLLGSPSLTQTRHRHHLQKCQQYLSEFTHFVQQDIVAAAERLRLATRELGRITGAVSAEDILDVIFRDFCIGK